MRHLKACGLAILGTLAVLAIFSAAPAMGEGVTALCNVHDSPCPEKELTKTLHWENQGTLRLLNEPIDILCLEVLLIVEALEPGNPQQLHATTFDLDKCGWNSAHSVCTVTMEELPTFTALQIALDIGILTAENGEMDLFCQDTFLLKSCSFDLTGMELGFIAGHIIGINGTIISLILGEGGSLCNEAGILDFLLEPLEEVHLVSQTEGAATALCKTHYGLSCSEVDLTQSLHLVGAGPTSLLSDVANIECEDSLATAGVSTLMAFPSRQKVTITKFELNDCRVEGVAASDCTVVAETFPVIELLKSALNLADVSVPEIEFSLKCDVLDLIELDCTFSDSVDLTMEGASHTEDSGHGRIIADNAELELLEGGEHCPDEVKWNAAYESLENVYVLA